MVMGCQCRETWYSRIARTLDRCVITPMGALHHVIHPVMYLGTTQSYRAERLVYFKWPVALRGLAARCPPLFSAEAVQFYM